MAICVIVYFGDFGNNDISKTSGSYLQSMTTETSEDISELIFVQISGEIINGGVYELPLGSRVFEAVEMAGGTTTRAALYMVNQAELLEDGDHIHFQCIIQNDHEGNGLVNLNTADTLEFTSLPGIGEAKALSIISFREENGYFEDVEDIMNVPGIKEAVFSQIKDYITIY